MQKPQDYFKIFFVTMTWITSSYMALGLTVSAYCGKWVAFPALGSVGLKIKIIGDSTSRYTWFNCTSDDLCA